MEILSFNQVKEILNFDGVLTINKIILWTDDEETKQDVIEWIKEKYPNKALISMDSRFIKSYVEHPRGFICVATKNEGTQSLKYIAGKGYYMNHCVHIEVGEDLKCQTC